MPLPCPTASFGTGLTYGGPVVCIFGWIFVSLLVLCEGLGMAELASAYPTSGGMYYWMFQLTNERFAPAACWVTGVMTCALCLLYVRGI